MVWVSHSDASSLLAPGCIDLRVGSAENAYGNSPLQVTSVGAVGSLQGVRI